MIDVDESYAMREDALAAAMAEDRAAGLTPFFVAATVGTTSSTALDPLVASTDACAELFVHQLTTGAAALRSCSNASMIDRYFSFDWMRSTWVPDATT